tara:strand:- start:429 stop:824 length:396 start_codon:yes stop_codon:yes gene_type:complete
MKFFITLYFIFLFKISINLFTKKPLKESLLDGKEIYNDFCAQCHLEDGKGVKGIYPPLAKSDFLVNVNRTISSIKYGLKGPITVNGEKYNSIMISQGLDDEEISDVVNYILNSWGNSTDKLITEEIVASIE